ncbi:MAG: type II toxin-antitoxin system VapC family toxin [Candidatus Rokubacteria bacterium]|nr:type II toxin-antitoxin system VapC family toxin [Candidatus Rokubacteria bacterium]
MVVLDSSFLIAYHNARDLHHHAAARAMERLVAGEWGRALLLEYVFLEVATVLLTRRGLRVAAAVASALLEAREVDFVPCSELFPAAWETFRTQPHGTLSFTDAAIASSASPRGESAGCAVQSRTAGTARGLATSMRTQSPGVCGRAVAHRVFGSPSTARAARSDSREVVTRRAAAERGVPGDARGGA